MSQVLELINEYSAELVLISLAVALVSIIVVIVNYVRTTKLLKKYKKLMRGADSKSLESMLLNHLDTVQQGMNRMAAIEDELKNQSARMKNCVQHIGIVRYNAFDNMGGDQSFSIAMLDDRGDGFVITSLYGRNTSTTFAKPVKARQSTYPLTDEEKEAIERSYRPKT
ncbi:MAG TPA: DUF4446 family protein [Candidatus Atribacteria bacterium]|nr:DUF4446 family protein [Candidatus Atribacteria bacterium]HPT78689.1 DUF4446 family protein [Candidatus Atribacteria bacterium]